MQRTAILIAASGLIALAGAVSAEDQGFTEYPLEGFALHGGVALADPDPSQPRDTHMHMVVTGASALAMFEAMAGTAEEDACTGGQMKADRDRAGVPEVLGDRGRVLFCDRSSDEYPDLGRDRVLRRAMRELRALRWLTVCAGLAGCGALAPSAAPEFEARFMGRPLNDVIAVLGPPDFRVFAEEGSGEGQLVRWEWTRPLEAQVPEFRSIGTGLLTITGYRRSTDLRSCLYEVRTDASGIVIDQRVEGQPAMCRSRLPR